MFLINFILWISFFKKKKIIKFYPIFIYFFVFLPIKLIFYKLNFININLINKISYYHTSAIYIYVYSQFSWLNKKWNLSGLIVIALIFGSIWSSQEINWGGWWNWDGVEIILLNFFFIAFIIWHSLSLKLKNFKFLKNLFFLNLIQNYFFVKLNIYTSIHNFVNIKKFKNFLVFCIFCIFIIILRELIFNVYNIITPLIKYFFLITLWILVNFFEKNFFKLSNLIFYKFIFFIILFFFLKKKLFFLKKRKIVFFKKIFFLGHWLFIFLIILTLLNFLNIYNIILKKKIFCYYKLFLKKTFYKDIWKITTPLNFYLFYYLSFKKKTFFFFKLRLIINTHINIYLYNFLENFFFINLYNLIYLNILIVIKKF